MPKPVSLEFSVAVHVLTYLADVPGGVLVSSDQLAGSTNTNPAYVRRVLAPLRRVGYVVSRPGSGGGWALAVPASSVQLGDLWCLFDGPAALLGLHRPDPSCQVGKSVGRQLEVMAADVATVVQATLNESTVQTLASAGARATGRP